MHRPRFYTTASLRNGQQLTLDREVSRHIAKALRMRAGDTLYLFDGSGIESTASITAVERNQVVVDVGETVFVDRESPLAITLAVALSRGDRMDTIMQKATELGVTAIWPFTSERTGVRLEGDRLKKKEEHWRRITISACEQCGRNRVPKISPTSSYEQLLEAAKISESSLRLLLHPEGKAKPLPERCESLLLMVGPEGGFTDGEVVAATYADFKPFLLGPRILRAETAPLTAIAVAQSEWGDLTI
ncbi:MAG: 16S rRNA (uracil(1498)-N(3))-methyltransferase [Congregibacter sp.]